jgi:DNA-binding LacI/PurR family transcriptional regulator
VHTATRTAAFLDVTSELGLAAEVVETDFEPESGARATRKLLSRPEPPTAIVYDSDLLAVTGLGVAHQMGFAVPDDISIVAWDDSLMCGLVHPPLTAVTRDIPAYGAAATKLLLATIDGHSPGDIVTPRGVLTPRGSTGSARAAQRESAPTN